MAVLRSYKCPRHGFFEAWEPLCEHGCTDVAQVILKAPSMRDSTRTSRTKSIDRSAKQLSADFGMTNIKTTREGEFQEGYMTRNNAKPEPREARPGDNLMWGSAGGHNMASLMSGIGVQPVGPSIGKEAERVGVNLNDPSLRRGPKPSMVLKDHENLSIPE